MSSTFEGNYSNDRGVLSPVASHTYKFYQFVISVDKFCIKLNSGSEYVSHICSDKNVVYICGDFDFF